MSNDADVPRDSPRPDSKADIVKCGHLKKQGGARGGRKNWKKRWFILKSDYICYFQEKDGKSADGPCLGVLPLRSAKVISVEQASDETSSPSQTMNSAAQVIAAASPVTTCYLCHKQLTKKVACKICQNVFCSECAAELQMGDKTSRVCSKCRCHHADDDVVKEQGTALELGVVVEVTQRDSKNSNSKFFKKERPPHLFAIKTKERELWLAAEDEHEKSSWVNAIADVIISFKKAAAAATESGAANKEEASVPSGTVQSEIEYEAITILQKIGDGAFGEVFKGRLWGTDVAVKTIKPDQVTEGVVEDLKKEVAILSQLRHPNIVLYIGACTKPPNVCIVTEWCDRGSLHDVLHDSNIPLDIQRIVALAVGIAQGMNYLHSLERRIIHRDLKSHNIVVDRNFNVKVADFGLSHVRESLTQRTNDPNATQNRPIGIQNQLSEPDLGQDDEKSMRITSESMGGHYGVFGTPEWMAPEIMEGTAYNQKVDVYSFGIMMSELLTRKLPFRDQYKIKSYLDVVDAVLDDGAMPTLPPWIGARLRRLIELCLSRNANTRPSFTSIILKLRSIFSASPADLFIAFDIPRITHMLSSSDRHNQALAAKEISLFKFDHEFLGDGERRVCSRCKYSAAQHRPLDDATITLFIVKLTDMLASSSAKVVLPAVEALERLVLIGRQRPDAGLRTENLRTICEKNGVERLIGLVASKSERLSQTAGRALMLLVDDLPVDDMSYRALKPTSLNVLSNLMMKEIVNLRENTHKLNEALQEIKDTVSALKSSLSSIKSQQVAPNTAIARTLTPPISSQAGEAVPVSSPVQSQESAERVVVSDTVTVALTSHVEVPAQLRPVIENARITEEASARQPEPEVVSDPVRPAADDIALARDGLQRQQTTDSEPDSSVMGNTATNAMIFWPATPPVPIPPILPASTLDPMQVFADWALVHDSNTGIWQPKYVIVQPSLIVIFSSYEIITQGNPPKPEFVINASVPAGKKLKYKSGRRYKQPHCFHLCCQGLKWWFALRSEKDTVLWGNILTSPLPEPVEHSMQCYLNLQNRVASIPPVVGASDTPLPQQTLNQQDPSTPSFDAAVLTSEVPKPSLAIEEEIIERIPIEFVATPAPSAGFARKLQEEPIHASLPPSEPKSSDEKSAKEPCDNDELDKSQIEMQFELSDLKPSGNLSNSASGKHDAAAADPSGTTTELQESATESPETTQHDTIAQVDGNQSIVNASSTVSCEDTAQTEECRLDNHHIDYTASEQKTRVDDEPSLNSEHINTAQVDDVQPENQQVDNVPSNRGQNTAQADRSKHDSQDIDIAISEVELRLNNLSTDDANYVAPTPLALFFDAPIDDGPLTVRSLQDPTTPHFEYPGDEDIGSDSSYVVIPDHFDVTVMQDSDGSVPAAAIPETDEVNNEVVPDSRLQTRISLDNYTISTKTEPAFGGSLHNANPVAKLNIAEPSPEEAPDDQGLATPLSRSSDASDSLTPTAVNKLVQRFIDVASPTITDAKMNLRFAIKSGDDLISPDKSMRIRAMPPLPSLPEAFVLEYGRRDCWHYAYLLIANVKSMKWEHRFVILLGSHPRRLLTFRNHESPVLIDEFVLESGARVADQSAIEHCLGVSAKVDPRLSFIIDVRSKDDSHRDLLCICGSEVERHKWMSLIERVILISRPAT